ncbi:MAG: SGNH/GDSL hydrolase family protein [Flavobacteriales bacterium]|nr:SGNH/GDSL hydrolase family protein [Flavobacteriales bacterium]MCB9448160.1 SGNH/GDSL hydrolase family protein [Flavobacteriales bacterium]
MKPEGRQGIGRYLLWTVWCLVLMALTEAAYRYQWFDFYQTELVHLNPPKDLTPDNTRKTVLVMGDSFSASAPSYVDVLRKRHPQYRFVNSAVPGTCVIQAGYMAPGRIATFNPDILICQIYCGNDLWDIRHSYTSPSRLRNLYWQMSDHMRVLGWINYKLALWATGENDSLLIQAKQKESFSPDDYSPREKIILSSEPDLVASTLSLLNERNEDFNKLCHSFDEIVDVVSPRTQTLFLIIPHAMQVDSSYWQRWRQLGATGDVAIDTLPSSFTHQLAEHFSRNKNVHVLDATLALRTGEKQQAVYFANDPHLTPYGQQVVADFISEHGLTH